MRPPLSAAVSGTSAPSAAAPAAQARAVTQAAAPAAGHAAAPASAADTGTTPQPGATPADPAPPAWSSAEASSVVPAAASAIPPSSPAAPTTTPAVSVTSTAGHAAVAAQVAPALLSLSGTAAGTQHLTLRLQPADLGTVQIRIDRPLESPARVEISVSRPETLTLLLRDQTQLERTLDLAGVPAEGRTLSFHLAGQDADSPSRQSGGFAQPGTPGQADPGGTYGDEEAAAGAVPARLSSNLAGWLRAGLDITA